MFFIFRFQLEDLKGPVYTWYLDAFLSCLSFILAFLVLQFWSHQRRNESCRWFLYCFLLAMYKFILQYYIKRSEIVYKNTHPSDSEIKKVVRSGQKRLIKMIYKSFWNIQVSQFCDCCIHYYVLGMKNSF